MKLNNRGIAITSIVYIILVIGLILILSTLGILSSRKLVLDKMKSEVYDSLSKEKEKVTTYYQNGQEVYYNVTTGKKCDSTEVLSESGTKEGCMKFYAFNDEDGSTTLNLVLGHNTSETLAWKGDKLNAEQGPLELIDRLKLDTDSWIGTLSQLRYNYESYEINYKGYKARLITLEDISKILNIDLNSITSSSDDTQIPQDNEWLYNMLDSTESNGYWTATGTSGEIAWVVDKVGNIKSIDVTNSEDYGVRPVITIEKSRLE